MRTVHIIFSIVGIVLLSCTMTVELILNKPKMALIAIVFILINASVLLKESEK